MVKKEGPLEDEKFSKLTQVCISQGKKQGAKGETVPVGVTGEKRGA